MGLTQRLGTIPLAIQTDSSNNVGIGGAANASYKLAVTGAAAFTSDLSVTGGSYYLQRASSSAILPVLRYWNGTGNPMNGGALGDILTIGTQGTNDFTIATDNTRRLTITSSGNVGIGTSSPGYPLIVSRTLSSEQTLFTLDNATNTQNNFGMNFTVLGYLPVAAIRVIYPTENNLSLAFFTYNGAGNVNERMRISQPGNLLIGTTSDGGDKLAVVGQRTYLYHNVTNRDVMYIVNGSASPYGINITFDGASPNNTTNNFIYLADTGGLKCRIVSNGSIYNNTGTYGTISDAKFKENIVDATPKLDDILKLKVRNFNLIGDETKQIGFVAQEFEEVFPNMVDNSKDKETGQEYKAIKTSVLVPMLVKAIQELSAKVTALENK